MGKSGSSLTGDKRKNGKIELMRFVFCVIIILFHLNNRLSIPGSGGLTFFASGRIGVEYFFIVSGYLLANHAVKRYESKSVPKETSRFIFNKFLSVFPYHIITFAALLVMYFAIHGFAKRDFFQTLADFLPNLFLIQRSGLPSYELITSEWYIAAMILMMVIIYPLVLTFKDKYTKIAAPVITIIGIGAMVHTSGGLGGTWKYIFSNSIPKIYLRAFVEITAGTFCFEAARFLRGLNFTKKDRVFLTAAEIVCYAFPVVYTFLDWPSKYEGQMFYMLAAAVTLSFSEVTYFGDAFKTKAIYRLGKLSLPLYFTQEFSIMLIKGKSLSGLPLAAQVAVSLVITAVTGVILEPLAQRLLKACRKKLALLRGRKKV